MREYDVIIAGGGVAGAFAAYKLSKTKNTKVCLIEFGRPPGKRRKQLEGWLGCFPTGNSRLYLNDVDKVKTITNTSVASKAEKDVFKFLSDYGNMKPVKDKKVNENVKKRIIENNYDIEYLSYIQWKPENVHLLSRGLSDFIEKNKNIELCFDNGIKDISKINDKFVLETEMGVFKSKKLILCLGRSGWRFTRSIYNKFGLIENDDDAVFGFMGEVPVGGLKDWNGSHCVLTKENIKIGPLSWKGTVIPEDHVDLVISSWRSNEDRWNSEKVAFSVRITEKFKNLGVAQTVRLGQLAFVLCDNRVGRIRVSEYMHDHHDLSLIPEYGWLKEKMKDINKVIPNFLSKGYINVPDISLVTPKIKIKKDLSTNIEGLFVAGESAGIYGIISAALTGYIAA